MYRIKFIREEKEILVEPGTRILEAERKANLVPDAPCGGRGKCGKCRVKIEDHMVLACQTEIYSDLEVDTLSGCQEEEILTEGMQRPVAFRPDLKQKTPAPSGRAFAFILVWLRRKRPLSRNA